jgi:hypothetical protein
MTSVEIYSMIAKKVRRVKGQPAAKADLTKKIMCTVALSEESHLLVTDDAGLTFRFAPAQFDLADGLLAEADDSEGIFLTFVLPDGRRVERDYQAKYMRVSQLLGLIFSFVEPPGHTSP